MSKFKAGDRVRDITEHSANMGLEKAGEGNLSALSGGRWTVSWDNKMMGPIAWGEDQLELVASPTSGGGPVRTRTVSEIVPGTYGRLEVMSGPVEGAENEVQIRLRVSSPQVPHLWFKAGELRELATFLSDIATHLEENAK